MRLLAVRDSLEEAEITAGLIQKKVEKGAKPSEIGLLLPNDSLCLMAVENVFTKSGHPLSGFYRSFGKRDLGRETLREFLLCLRKPAPIMAIAALLTSPLMPWPLEEGHSMAQAVMGGDVFLSRKKIPDVARKIMDILNDGATESSDLQRQLKYFIAELSADEAFHDHLQVARETAIHLQQALSGMEELDWDRLLYLVNPESLTTPIPTEFWQEGIRVFHEGALPWCNIKHLFVLGFNEGHYPAGTGSSAVFTDAEWERIAEAGWPVATNDLILEQQRSLFVNQLSAATEEVTFLFSQRDAGGQALEYSGPHKRDSLLRCTSNQKETPNGQKEIQ